MKVIARSIYWDKTDDMGNPVNVDLPSEVTYDDYSMEDFKDTEDLEDAVMERLTEDYGFCHFGAFIEIIKE